MQDEFTDIILENFPIKGTAERIGKAERDTDKGFKAKDVIPEGNNKKNQRVSNNTLLSFQGFFYRAGGFLEFDKFLFNVKPCKHSLQSEVGRLDPFFFE